ncbi:MAG: AAA family ATPase [Methylocystis sp.]
MLNSFQLLRNIGQFDSVASGARLPLSNLTVLYAENGRGKTTLAAILRSVSTGAPLPINERKRLAAGHAPHVVLAASSGPNVIFQNDSWTRTLPEIVVFDDTFVADNICSGMEVETGHRQNLHELILGARGVTLNRQVQGEVSAIEEHNRQLRSYVDTIPAAIRGTLTIDAFCALPPLADCDALIQRAQRNLAAAKSAAAVRTRPLFDPINLPGFDTATIEELLCRQLPNVEADASARLNAHLARLGDGGENWVAEGVIRMNATPADGGSEPCPFCAQSLAASPLIACYREYFSAAYSDLKGVIAAQISATNSAHDGEISAAFERSVAAANQNREFWSAFVDVPEIPLDTAAVARAWKAAREQVIAALRAKQAAPLEAAQLSQEAQRALREFEQVRRRVQQVSETLEGANLRIAIVKEQSAAANVSSLEADLTKLQINKARHTPDIDTLCQGYLTEKAAKTATETRRDQARESLDQYRATIFPAYETVINNYLQRFNAGFRLGSVNSVNTRSGSSCTYNVLINNVPVPVTAATAGEPSFRTTLSAGDRNTLALAFFFASLDQDPQLAQKIVIIDDPMTSLDEHRSLTTVQEMRRLLARVAQVIVLSHSKSFLCDLWQGADTTTRAAIRIDRDGSGSTLASWDVNQDCITEHDRRHAVVSAFIETSVSADEREVAAALRPILEAFMRVAYPTAFPPGTLLGPFIGVCRQREGTPAQILSNSDTIELRDLLDYANKFHHDTNPAWQTVLINDLELKQFCERTLAFARRV